MKIAFVIRSLGIGGAERQLATLAAGLARRGHTVRVLVFYPQCPLGPLLAAAGVTVVHVGKRGRWDLLGFLSRLASELKDLDPDIVHSYLIPANLAAVLSRFVVPRAKLVWGIRDAITDFSAYGLFARIVGRTHRLLARVPHLVIANSAAGAELFSNARRVVVIHNGIDTSRFCPRPDLRTSFRAELGLGSGETVIGMVGRLDPVKDHPTFLRAAAQVAKQVPGVRFLIVGEGEERYSQELRALADELGVASRVSWVKPLSEPAGLYNTLDGLALSSRSEAFPNVVAEALACGVPAVVTNVGEAAQVVSNAERVVDPGDADALARAIVRMIADSRRDAAEQLHQSVKDRFSPDRLVEKTVAELERAMGAVS